MRRYRTTSGEYDSFVPSASQGLALLADDVEVISLGGGQPGIEFTRGGCGKAAAARYLARLAEGWEMLRYEVEDFIAERDRVVVLGWCAFRNRRTGKVADTLKVDVYRFRDGLVVEFREFYDTAAMREAAAP
jgi:uncharacterized protein